MEEEKKSFWVTLPGLLTGFAALLTAASTLYVAMHGTPDSSPPAGHKPEISQSNDKAERLSSDAIAEKLIGIWYSESGGNTGKGKWTYRATTEYLRNSMANVTGEYVYKKEESGKSMEFVYSVEGAIEWQLHDHHLIQKVLDIKSVPTMIRVNGEAHEVTEAGKKQLPRLDDFFVKGRSEESVILEIGPHSARLQTHLPSGEEHTETIERRNRPFHDG